MSSSNDTPEIRRQSGDSGESDQDRDQRFASIGRLAATMAHEFNNVLMGIQPFIEVISRGADRAQVEKALKHIALSIHRGKQITAEVLRMAHPAEPRLQSVGAAAWLKSIEMDLRGVLPKSVELRIEIDEGPDPLYVACDINQMNQVLMNLVMNARDAMAGGGTLIVAAARCYSWMSFPLLNLTTPDRFVHLTIADTGCGMDARTLEKIFEPLYTTKRNGTGLGLAVVKQILQRHGGTVSVESTPGRGTRFHLFLPAALPREYEDTPAAPERHASCRTDLRLLIVEDDRNVSTATANSLRQLGFHVDAIHTGGRAAEAVARFHSDAVVLDVGLPDISGAEVFWLLRREFPELPIVFSTAHADESTLASQLAEARVAYLSKPYTTETLLDALSEVTQVH